MYLNIKALANDLNKSINQIARELDFDRPNLVKISQFKRKFNTTLLTKLIDIYKLEPNDILKYRVNNIN